MNLQWYAIVEPAGGFANVRQTYLVRCEGRYARGLCWHVAQTEGAAWVFVWNGSAWAQDAAYRKGDPKPFTGP